MSDDAVYCIESAVFVFREAYILWFFCQEGIKRIATTFHENQRLNIENQYQKDAT